MFGNPMLDVAIGLSFLYVILSVGITALQEYIAAISKLRSRTLAKGINELVGQENLAALYKHPLIFPLFQGGVGPDGTPKKGPSYIPARNFALAVFDLQSKLGGGAQAASAGGANQSEAPPAFALAQFFLDQTSGASLKRRVERFDETAKDIVAGIQDPDVKGAASKALAAAVGEMKTATDVVNNAVEQIESLFNSSMRRVEGWYKRITQHYTLALSIGFAILINADSIYIGQRLWLDDDLRAQTVAAAEAFYKNEKAQDLMFKACGEPDANGQSGTDTAEPAPNPGQPQAESSPKPGQPSAQDKALKELECAKLRFDAAMEASVESAGFPLGWRMRQGWFHQDQSIILAVFGWVLTGLALSLGSSFWFDLLGKFMKVRQSGARESSEPQNPPQDGKTQ